MSEQVSFGTTDPAAFVDNPEPRCPCILLLDVSGSMRGRPLDELNEGLRAFHDELLGDTLASKRVEISIVTFGPVNVELPFTTAPAFQPPTLQAQGDTPMGAAIMQALSMVEQRKAEYRSNGIKYFRPWVFMITDGGPTDAWQDAAQAVRAGSAKKQFAFFAVGVHGADMDTLRKICSDDRPPLALSGMKFREMFIWLSGSMRKVSESKPGTDVAITPPTGWTQV